MLIECIARDGDDTLLLHMVGRLVKSIKRVGTYENDEDTTVLICILEYLLGSFVITIRTKGDFAPYKVSGNRANCC